jgi:hypothetical protein
MTVHSICRTYVQCYCCEGYECKHLFIVSFLHVDVEVFQLTADSSVLSGRLTGVTLELGGLLRYY